MIRLLITRRIQDNLDGSGAGQAVGRWWNPGDPFPEGEDADTMGLMVKCLNTDTRRKDRAVWVDLTDGELEALEIYVGAMEAGARDNAWDPDGLADLNAAVALTRQISKAEGLATR